MGPADNEEDRMDVAVTPEDVAHLGALASLRLTEEECRALAPEIDVILHAMAKVQEVARDGVDATTHALARTNVFREDVVRPCLTPDEALSGAPAVEDGRFRVPAILGEE